MELPFLEVQNNVVLGVAKPTDRKPLLFKWEGRDGKENSMIMTCNSCDRIVWEDEMDIEEFNEGPGYCPDCLKETE